MEQEATEREEYNIWPGEIWQPESSSSPQENYVGIGRYMHTTGEDRGKDRLYSRAEEDISFFA